MKLTILFLMFCALLLFASAKRNKELKPWVKKEKCPTVNVGKYASYLINHNKSEGNNRKQLKKRLSTNWCDVPSSIANGKVATPCGCGFGQTAKYSCKKGYKLQPKECKRLKCLGNHLWSGQEPVCIADCDPLPAIENGCIHQNSTKEGATAKYVCYPTYHLTAGSAERTCLADKTWSGEPATCSPIKCADLPHPNSGSVSQDGSMVGAVAHYSCESGYKLSGSNTRFCSMTGSWTGTEPKCDPIHCDLLPAIENGCIRQNSTREGATAKYVCYPTYTLTAGSAERTCLADKTWSGERATCSPINCADLPHPNSGSVSQSGSMVGAVTNYSCESGYKLSGSNTRFCSMTGSWTGTEPKCVKDCGLPESPSDGTVVPDVPGETTVGNTVTYSCKQGYVLSGDSSRTCTTSGWDGNKPGCIKDCGLPEPPSNGTVVPDVPGLTTLGHTVTYSCNQGYTLSGDSTRTCTTSGWGGNKPSCIKDCEYSGETYSHGDNFQTDGDCHNCTCEFGSVQCTGKKACYKTHSASQSSESWSYRPASNAIDGNINTISHTANNNEMPWWMLEYECPQTFIAVNITNRKVSHNQLRNLDIYVDDQLCGHIDGPLGHGESRKVECPEPLNGKRLKLAKQIREVLNLAEVQPILAEANGCLRQMAARTNVC